MKLAHQVIGAECSHVCIVLDLFPPPTQKLLRPVLLGWGSVSCPMVFTFSGFLCCLRHTKSTVSRLQVLLV